MRLTASRRGIRSDKRKLTAVLIAFSILLTLALAALGGFYFPFARTGETRLLSHYAAETINDADCKRLRIPSGNHSLQGYLFGEDSRKGIIIVAHGFHADANCHLAEITDLAAQGWYVLAFDGTGAGQSDGATCVGLEQMRLDLRSVIDYVRGDETLGELPIVLYGHSMGGYACASLSDDPEVSAVISIAGFNDPTEAMTAFSKKYVGPLAYAAQPVMALRSRIRFGYPITAADAINAADTPVLIVYGSEDETVTPELSIYAHRDEITNPNAEYLYVDDPYRGEHSTAWLSEEAARSTLALSEELDALLDRYGEDIPPEEQQLLSAQLQQCDAFETDPEFLAQVLEFCEAAVK